MAYTIDPIYLQTEIEKRKIVPIRFGLKGLKIIG